MRRLHAPFIWRPWLQSQWHGDGRCAWPLHITPWCKPRHTFCGMLVHISLHMIAVKSSSRTKSHVSWLQIEDFNVVYSSRWGYSLINTLKLKKKLKMCQRTLTNRKGRRFHQSVYYIFDRPVDLSRSISTVDKDSAICDYGRHRRSIRIHLLENTVDIARPSIPAKKTGRNRPSMWVDTTKKSVEIDTKKTPVDINRRSGHGLQKSWTLTSLTLTYFITKRCKWLTRTLTSVHPDPFPALLTKQDTRKKQTHTDKLYNGHRVKSIWRMCW